MKDLLSECCGNLHFCCDVWTFFNKWLMEHLFCKKYLANSCESGQKQCTKILNLNKHNACSHKRNYKYVYKVERKNIRYRYQKSACLCVWWVCVISTCLYVPMGLTGRTASRHTKIYTLYRKNNPFYNYLIKFWYPYLSLFTLG